MAPIKQIIDTSQSKVSFSIKKLGFLTIKGTLSDFQGSIAFDENNLQDSNFEVSVSTISIDTGNAKRDEHLKSKDFFYVKEFPKISFQSTDVKNENEQLLVMGQLTLLEKSQEISIPFTHQNGELKGSFSLSRFDFGLGIKFPSFVVGKVVQININVKIK